MPTDPTGAERQRRWKARQAGLLPPVRLVPCATCPRHHTGAHGDQCWQCWRKTEAGRRVMTQQRRNQRAGAIRNNL